VDYTSNTSFKLTAGPAHDTAVVGCTCIIIDQADTTQVAVGRISAYTTAANTVTLESDPLAAFTFANGDTVLILPHGRGVDAAAILTDTAQIGVAGVGLSNINLPNQTMDITGTWTGNLTGSVGSLTGHTNQTADHTANIALILGDSNMLQTDWVNGGRLDNLLDTAAAGGATYILDTTVNAGASTTSFTLAAGVTNDNAYYSNVISVYDVTDAHWEVRPVTAYVGASRTITVSPAFTFTPANGDTVHITENAYIASGGGGWW